MTFTTDPALKLQAVADAMAVTFSAVSGATVLAWEPAGLDIPIPCICIGDAGGSGTPIDGSAHQLDKDDEPETWTVRLYCFLEDPQTDWASARSLIGQMRQAIDNDWQLGGEVREARITQWSLGPYLDPQGSRRLLVGECTVSILYLMNSA